MARGWKPAVPCVSLQVLEMQFAVKLPGLAKTIRLRCISKSYLLYLTEERCASILNKAKELREWILLKL